MRQLTIAAIAVIAALTGMTAAPVEAQLFTPSYMAPRPSSDIGIYLSDGPGDFAVEGILRRSSGAYDLGFRAGIADTNDLSVLLGVELRNPIAISAPIDVAVTGGAQGAFGDISDGGLLLGVSIGHTFVAPELGLTPYLHPRIGLVTFDEDGDDIGLELLADLGFDVSFNRNLELRFGISLDDVAAEWGIGLAWR
jgi:hypothetical protein